MKTVTMSNGDPGCGMAASSRVGSRAIAAALLFAGPRPARTASPAIRRLPAVGSFDEL